MNDYLKRYTITLKTLSPVFIGSGEQLGKKEYVFNTRKEKAWIFNPKKLYHHLAEENLLREYEKYMLQGRQDLYSFMYEHNIKPAQYEKWAEYSLDCRYTDLSTNKDLHLFIKDPYGNPYIPGSSLKGALRTALLGYEVSENRKIAGLKNEIQNGSRAGKRRDLTKALDPAVKRLETEIFHTVDRGKDVKKENAVCDALAGMRVSDSTPVDKKRLVLCQKVDQNIDRRKSARELPMLRECLQPGIKLTFDLTIDETLCSYTGQTILDAVSYFSRNAHVQYKKYGQPQPQREHVLTIGGGAGYISKTAVYNLYQDRAAVQVAANIMKVTTPRNHGHANDVKNNVSPHTLKVTKFGGRTYQFGQCEIQIAEKMQKE